MATLIYKDSFKTSEFLLSSAKKISFALWLKEMLHIRGAAPETHAMSVYSSEIKCGSV